VIKNKFTKQPQSRRLQEDIPNGSISS